MATHRVGLLAMGYDMSHGQRHVVVVSARLGDSAEATGARV
jgi:hypothetical protein